MSIGQKLYRDKIIKNVEPYIFENIQYETIMGSEAYGVSSGSSDMDLYAFTIPPKRIVFPHTAGHVYGFGKAPESFKSFQKHHIMWNDKEYDIVVYNIVTYFNLLMENNPNIIDSLFTREQSVTFSSTIGDMVKSNRHIFLHKGAWYKFKGYAYSQLKKIRNKKHEGKRKELIEQYGYDVKFAYHVVRLLNEIEDILLHGDIDLMKNREQLKSIRSGVWTLKQLEDYFSEKEKMLEKLFLESTLPKYPDEEKIKQLLLNCLEEFYGTIGPDAIQQSNEFELAIRNIQKIVKNL